MKKQEIVTIANELMGNPSKKQEYRLLNSLVGHHSIKRLTEEQFDTVCTFCEEVSTIREQMFKDLVTENDSEVDAIESIYNVSQRIKDMIEEAALGELKKTQPIYSTDGGKRYGELNVAEMLPGTTAEQCK
jgi:hypothetical protein